MTQIATDQVRLRENMKSLKGTSEEKHLLQRYVKQLDEQENRIEQLRAEMQKLAGQLEAAKSDLSKVIEALKVTVAVPATSTQALHEPVANQFEGVSSHH